MTPLAVARVLGGLRLGLPPRWGWDVLRVLLPG